MDTTKTEIINIISTGFFVTEYKAMLTNKKWRLSMYVLDGEKTFGFNFLKSSKHLGFEAKDLSCCYI